MAIQASDGPWMKNPSGRREEAAPGWGGPYASPGAAARTSADDPFHDDWAHWPAE